MTTEKKFKTFADLRLISRPSETLQLPDTDTDLQDTSFEPPSIPSIPSTPSIRNIPSTPRKPSTSSTTTRTSTSKNTEPRNTAVDDTQQSIAPIRDFQKVPNSVTREIMPLGLFKGKSKQVYDYLYSTTRGAINPHRTTRKSRKEIQRGSGIGSMVTVDAALFHLESIGLIRIRSAVGSLIGNEYEIFTPEEAIIEDKTSSTSISSRPNTSSSTPNLASTTSPIQILGELDVPFSSTSRASEVLENKDTSSDAKTFLKTKEEKRIDDEPATPFRSFEEKLNQGFRELTGREANPSDEQKLAQLGELITAELMEAAARTKVVSDPAAFLLTHLRRRLGVRTIKVETSLEREIGKGTASTKPTRREIQLSDDEIQECPDCQGRLLIYPQGQGKGAVMCKHPSLIKAKQSEQSNLKKEEGK